MSINATHAKKGTDVTAEEFEFARAGDEKINVCNHSHDNPSEHTYTVTVWADGAVDCTCPDHTYRARRCKHMRAVDDHLDDIMTDGGRDTACRGGNEWCPGPQGESEDKLRICFPCHGV